MAANSASLSAEQQRELDNVLLGKKRDRAIALRRQFEDDMMWAGAMLDSGVRHMKSSQGSNDFMSQAAIMFFELARDTCDPTTSTRTVWVKAQLNIGSALARKATLDRRFSFDDAIASFASALRYADITNMPVEWVKLNLTLGRAYLGKARRVFDRADLVSTSRRSFCRILAKIPPDKQDSQLCQLRVAALRELGKALWVDNNTSHEDVQVVLTKSQEALENLLSTPKHAVEHARIWFGLGRALSHPAMRNISESQERAIQSFQEALRHLNPNFNAPEWIRTNTFLSSSFVERRHGDPARNIELAIGYGVDALDTIKKNNITDESLLGDAYDAMGNALMDRTYGSRLENIREAVKCFKLAVSARTVGTLSWASSNSSLASALCNPLVIGDEDAASRGLDCYVAALSVFSPQTTLHVWIKASTNYGLSLRRISYVRGGDAEMLEEAVKVMRGTLEVAGQNSYRDQWAVLHHNLSMALFELAGEGMDTPENTTSSYAESLRCSIEALKIWNVESYPLHFLECLRQLLRVTVASENFEKASRVFERFELEFSRAYSVAGPGMASSRALSDESSVANRLMFAKCIENHDLSYAIQLCEKSKAMMLHSMIKESVLRDVISSSVKNDSQEVVRFHDAREQLLASRQRAINTDSNSPPNAEMSSGESCESAKEMINSFVSDTLSQNIRNIPAMSALTVGEIHQFIVERGTLALIFYFAPSMQEIRRGQLNDSLHLLLLFENKVVVVTNESIRDPSRHSDLDNLFVGPALYRETEAVRSNRQAQESSFLESVGLLIDQGIRALSAVKSDLELPSRVLIIPHRGLHRVPFLAVQVHALDKRGSSTQKQYLGEAFSDGIWVCPSISIAHALLVRGENSFHSAANCDVVTVEGPGTGETRAIHEKLQEGRYFSASQATLLEEQCATKRSLTTSQDVRNCHALNVIAHGIFCNGGSALDALDDREAFVKNTGLNLVQDSAHGSFFNLTDIWTLGLGRCGLACIAACFGGTVNSISGDDESLSIGTSFLVAGAQCVVCSLWPVHKAVAAVIIDRFWTNIGRMRKDPSNGLCISRGLLEAAGWFRTLDSKQYLMEVQRITDDDYELEELPPNKDPNNWAAFQVFGAPEGCSARG